MQKNLTKLECYLSGIDSLGYATTFPENEEKTIENIIVHTDEGDLSLKAFIQDSFPSSSKFVSNSSFWTLSNFTTTLSSILDIYSSWVSVYVHFATPCESY